jgi:regulation of enolase protein 1 (concanavalin A-like superfamily)
MVINTARLEPDVPMPSTIVWGQGAPFNNRLVQEINKESNKLDFVIYRLTVDNITQALIDRFNAGVPTRVLIDSDQYINHVWPEYTLTHAYVDALWAAGVPIRTRVHQGLTHMKLLITSSMATIASSNYAQAWQRDHDYFMPVSDKPGIYTAIQDKFDEMWNDPAAFGTFHPTGPDAPSLASPANGGTATTTPTLVWTRPNFATNFDVMLGTSPNALSRVGNVAAQMVNNPPDTYSWTAATPLACSTTYYWRIVSRTNATPRDPSLVNPSSTRSFTTGTTNCGTGGGGGGGTVPSPWTSQDVGSTGQSGSADYASGVFTVSGAGADIWGSSDAFRFVSQSASGDVTIVARVTGEQNTSSFAKAGVMLRGSTSASAAHVILDVRPDGGVEFMTRSSSGGSTSFIAGTTGSFPVWLKLSRSGSTVTGSVSSNGSTWSVVGTTSPSLSSTVLAGLAVTSHNTSALNTATFDNVAVNGTGTPPPPPPDLPSPWTHQDVGSTGLAGSASVANGVFTVSGAGADIWGTADAFQFVNQSINGDVQIVARLTSEQNTNTYAKAGVMLRANTGSNSAHVLLDVRPDGSVEFMTRGSNGGETSFIAGGSQLFPAWLKLARSGSTVTGYVSGNGSTWTTIGSVTSSIPGSALIGLIVTSHTTSALNTANFDNVSVTAGSEPPPPPPPAASEIVIYASDIADAGLHGSWTKGSDPAAANTVTIATPDNGVANTDSPLANPADYVDVTFNAVAGTPYRIWLRLKALNNSKFNDAVWLQFSGASNYPINSTSGLLVNLATDSSASSLNGWGWQNGAYWLSQATAVTFGTTGSHTLRIQVREDGASIDQIVLSPSAYYNSAPGSVTNDSTIVPKP